jgi:hypothetical protein
MGFGDPAGVSVTYPLSGQPLSSAEKITLLRLVNYDQQTSITNQGGFYPAVIERALDHIVFQCQQLAEKVARTVAIPVSTSLSSPLFPAPSSGKFLRSRADGAGWENADIAGAASIGVPVPIAQGGTNATNAAQARTNLGLASGATTSVGTAATQNVGTAANNVIQLDLNARVPAVDGSQIANLPSMRNLIINGKMDIAQRGSSIAGVMAGAAAYSVDRWRAAGGTTTGVITMSQQSDVPTADFQNSLRATVTSADASVGANDIFLINQVIEGYNARALIGRTFTLSFWVKSSKIGIHCMFLENGGADRTYVAEYPVNSANTWEFKSINIAGGLITTGTWNWTNGYGLSVGFALMSGSTFQTTANAWQVGNFGSTANQVNVLDTVGNIFAITGVQLELGSQATAFEHRPFGHEVALCQRYYEKSFNRTVAPAQNAGTGGELEFPSPVGASVGFGGVTVQFKTAKRATPTITLFNPVAANGQIRNFSNGTDCSAATTSSVAENCFSFGGTTSASTAAGHLLGVHWTADAEL